MTPYASVILPTFNRSNTLPYALASVQAQTESALDIAIVLDGATEECREVAVAAAQADDRIRVLDLPKAPGYGEENHDLAIRSALGERIFYIDDDDVWLPQHVASLGPLLEEADIAESRVCSVDRRGRLHLGPCRASSPRMRRHLADLSLKILYDTHIAHRKDAYGRLSSLVLPRRSEAAVTDFLAGFAGHSDCRWASYDAVTALSIHGAARTDHSPSQRATEIAYWQDKARDLGESLSSADSAFHLFRLLMVDPPRAEITMEEYLAARGGYEPAGRNSRERDLFSLFAGEPPAESTAVELALFLSEPVESGYMFESIALAYFQAYGQDGHERILYAAQAKAGGNRAGCLAAYSVALSRRDPPRALFVAQDAAALGPDPVRSLARWHESLLAQSGTDR